MTYTIIVYTTFTLYILVSHYYTIHYIMLYYIIVYSITLYHWPRAILSGHPRGAPQRQCAGIITSITINMIIIIIYIMITNIIISSSSSRSIVIIRAATEDRQLDPTHARVPNAGSTLTAILLNVYLLSYEMLTC